MGAILALFQKKEERIPVPAGGGCLNAIRNNWRGLFSALLANIIFGMLARHEKESYHNMAAIWLTMFVFMLLVPMAVGASALLPVFTAPMFGILNSNTVCGALTNENIVLFFLGGWLLMIINNCGLDKRLVCWFLDQGDADSYTPHKMLLKSCMAAFCLSAIGEREMITQAIMTYIVAALEPLKDIKGEANFQELRMILCNAVAISSFLGSMCVAHASINTIQMRSLFSEVGTTTTELPDVFNFLNYSAYAIPTALVMFLLNLAYEAFLVSKLAGGKPLTARTKEQLQKGFKKNREDVGPMTNHEKVSVCFLVVILVCFFTRWSKWLHNGWATFRDYKGTDLCKVSDATTAAIFVVILHYLPKSLHFFKICGVQKHGDLPKMQRESGILFWRFIDKKTDYSLFILIGAGAIIYKGMVKTKLNESIYYEFGEKITGMDWNVGILLVVLVSVCLGSVMSGLAAQACLMPLMLGMAMTGKKKWPQRSYLVALGVGLGTGLGFVSPFPNSPIYWVPNVGKVGRKKQIMYSIASQVICGLILWLSLCFYAPLLWDPHDHGIWPQSLPGHHKHHTATTAAATNETTTSKI